MNVLCKRLTHDKILSHFATMTLGRHVSRLQSCHICLLQATSLYIKMRNATETKVPIFRWIERKCLWSYVEAFGPM